MSSISAPDLRANILIVDDVPANLLALEAILESLGQRLVRANSGEEALRRVLEDDFAVILLDVRMPGLDGMETATLIKGRSSSRHTPIIFLTADREDETNVERYYQQGVDFLQKPLNATILRAKVRVFVELSLRGKEIEQRRLVERELKEGMRRAQLGADVGAALTGDAAPQAALQACAESLVRHLDAGFARIWTLNDSDQVLELQASAGTHTHLDGPHGRVRVGDGKIGRIAEEARPHFSNDVSGDSWATDREWARRERIVGFAGYPLLVDARMMGVMALFTPHVLPEVALVELAGVANVIALGIERQRVDHFREILIGIVSHDLRGPLTTITTSQQLLLRSQALSEEQAQLATRTAGVANRMSRMIEQLLDLTRGRLGGGIPVAPVPMDINEVCAKVIDEVRAAHPGQSIVLERAADGAGNWDADRVAQVLANLIGNARHHGGDGAPVKVAVHTDDRTATIRVHNQGEPIPANLLPVIFDPFRRSGASTKPSAGLGLGLYICHQIVTGHGGTIDVDSDSARGTTFTVVLPRQVTPRRSPSRSPAPE